MANKPNRTDNKQTSRVVFTFSDIHFPLHDDRSLACAEEILADVAPTTVIYIGDGLQMDSVSHWLQDKRRSLEGQRLLRDYEGFNKILDRHQEIAPNAEFVYILGNHEDWVQQYLDLHPEMEGMLEVENGLRFRERGFQVVPFGQVYQVGRLTYMHGVYTNEHHAKATVLAFRRNIRYGHTHDVQQHTLVSPLDVEDKITAMSIGCLCNINPQYMRLRPNRWVHSVNVAYVRPDGMFNDYTVVITRGRATFNGKDFRA